MNSALLIPLFFILLLAVLGAVTAWTIHRLRSAEQADKSREIDPEKVDRVVQGYQEILADVASRLGLQGHSIAAAGRLVDEADGYMSAEIKEQLAQRLNEVIARNNQLRQDLYVAKQRLNTQHAELDRARAESRIDHLTQLPNRRAFEEKATELQEQFERRQATYALAIFDVDFFKSFNDTHGHAAGDAMLRTIAKAAQATRRDDDFLARIGGEEFALLLQSGPTECQFALERYRKAIETSKLRMDGRQLGITASFGLALIRPGESFADLLDRADAALYQAKESGKNQIWLHDGSSVISPGAPAGA